MLPTGFVGVRVRVGVLVAGAGFVGVNDRVSVAALVIVATFVGVNDLVAVAVLDGVRVLVGVAVIVGVAVRVGVAVFVGVTIDPTHVVPFASLLVPSGQMVLRQVTPLSVAVLRFAPVLFQRNVLDCVVQGSIVDMHRFRTFTRTNSEGKRGNMHLLLYGIIIGVAIAAILIVRLGDDQHPATVSSKSHPGNAPWYDYDLPEESR